MGSTDRKRLSQQGVEESTEAVERLRSVVNHVLDGIITIDHRGTITTFNPAAERIFGFAASEVIGENVKLLMPEPYHGEHDRYIADYLRTGRAKIIGIGRDVVGRRKDGSTFPMDLAVSEFSLGDERYFIGIVDRLKEVRPEDLTENSVLLGSPAQIAESLKRVESVGFDEVILYFNVGLKPHAQVKEEMARFMAEVAPAFASSKGSAQHVSR